MLRAIFLISFLLFVGFDPTDAKDAPAQQKEPPLTLYITAPVYSRSPSPEELHLIQTAKAIGNLAEASLFLRGYRVEVSIGLYPGIGVTSVIPHQYERFVLIPEMAYETRPAVVANKRRQRKFVEVEGFLRFTLTFERHIFVNARWEIKDSITVVEKARRDWFRLNDRRFDAAVASQFAARPEPEELLIQRALEKVLARLPAKEWKRSFEGISLPVRLYVDSSFISSRGNSWIKEAEAMVLLASRSMERQFKIGLEITHLLPVAIKGGAITSTLDIYRAAIEHLPEYADTLAVVLSDYNDPLAYFSNLEYEKIGLAEIGKKRILINRLPQPSLEYKNCEPYYNALTLVHEIGHAFGAVHVSDINSVMNHNLTYLSSDDFDSFNRRLLEFSLAGKLDFADHFEYLRFLVGLFGEHSNSYRLVDFPDVFYRFSYAVNDADVLKRLQSNARYRPFLLAAEGYHHMLRGELDQATDLFRKVTELLPGQAAPYYYLAQTALKNEGAKALVRASELGYYQAIRKVASQKK